MQIGKCKKLSLRVSMDIFWGRLTHICVSKLTIIRSDDGLSPGRCQAITWTNAGILLIGPLGINFSEIVIEIYSLSFKKMHLNMSSGKWRPFCSGLNVLIETLARGHLAMFDLFIFNQEVGARMANSLWVLCGCRLYFDGISNISKNISKNVVSKMAT